MSVDLSKLRFGDQLLIRVRFTGRLVNAHGLIDVHLGTGTGVMSIRIPESAIEEVIERPIQAGDRVRIGQKAFHPMKGADVEVLCVDRPIAWVKTGSGSHHMVAVEYLQRID